MKLIDLTGTTFGRLTVVRRAPTVKRQTMWLCRCECGTIRTVQAQNLKNGHTASCGCWQHGWSGTPTYTSWESMNRRCHSRSNPNYPNYGGRGIKVCECWRESFTAFLADMGPRPSLRHSIDRIDNDGNYEPGNCRWATRSEQRKNQRPNMRGRHIEFRGQRLSIRNWAAKLGIAERTLGARLRSGVPPEVALTASVHAGRSRAGKARHAARHRRA